MVATSSLIRDSRSATSALAVACASSSWVTTISCSERERGRGRRREKRTVKGRAEWEKGGGKMTTKKAER